MIFIDDKNFPSNRQNLEQNVQKQKIQDLIDLYYSNRGQAQQEFVKEHRCLEPQILDQLKQLEEINLRFSNHAVVPFSDVQNFSKSRLSESNMEDSYFKKVEEEKREKRIQQENGQRAFAAFAPLNEELL